MNAEYRMSHVQTPSNFQLPSQARAKFGSSVFTPASAVFDPFGQIVTAIIRPETELRVFGRFFTRFCRPRRLRSHLRRPQRPSLHHLPRRCHRRSLLHPGPHRCRTRRPEEAGALEMVADRPAADDMPFGHLRTAALPFVTPFPRPVSGCRTPTVLPPISVAPSKRSSSARARSSDRFTFASLAKTSARRSKPASNDTGTTSDPSPTFGRPGPTRRLTVLPAAARSHLVARSSAVNGAPGGIAPALKSEVASASSALLRNDGGSVAAAGADGSET
jgi:hypothetical protein